MAAAGIAGGAAAAFLYRNLIEVGKTVSHAVSVDYDVSSPVFARTVSQLLGPPLLKGNAVDILENGDQIFPAMLEAIRSAEQSITFENFVLTRGKVTSDFVEALAERAEAGVKVHFLQDAVGTDCLHGPEMDRMKSAGVEVEIFRYMHLRFNERTHRKLLIIDGRVGFIGGVGISDEWLGDGCCPGHWKDTQYRVQGPVTAQMQRAFMDNWLYTRGELLHGERYFPDMDPVGELTCQASKSSSYEGTESASLMYLYSMAAAHHSIRLATAYFIPDSAMVEAIVDARRRGVEVDIITPGPDVDRTMVRHAGQSMWGPLLEAGVRLYEYQPARYHSKYMIVDDLWTSVGSCNLDNRSLHYNEEANLNVLDADFAKSHVRLFNRDLEGCREVTREMWQHRPLKDKVIGSAVSLLRSQL